MKPKQNQYNTSIFKLILNNNYLSSIYISQLIIWNINGNNTKRGSLLNSNKQPKQKQYNASIFELRI